MSEPELLTTGLTILGFGLVIFGNVFSFLFDVRTTDSRIEIALFRLLPIRWANYDNILIVEEVRFWGLGVWAAENWRNRPLARNFAVIQKTGWVSRKMIVSPADAKSFVHVLKSHGVSVQELKQS